MDNSLEYKFTIKYVDGHQWSRTHIAVKPDTFAAYLLENIEHYNHEVESISYTIIDTTL